MKRLVGVLYLVALGVSVDGVGDDIPAGKLGFPLGTYLMIEGETAKTGFKVNPTCTLVVDTVNGKKLDKPTEVVFAELKGSLPQTGRIIVRGYESGKMIGLPSEVARKENLPEPQAGWQFYRYFVITSWVQPAGPVPPAPVPPPPPGLLPPGQLGQPVKPAMAAELDERLRRLREERARLLRDKANP